MRCWLHPAVRGALLAVFARGAAGQDFSPVALSLPPATHAVTVARAVQFVLADGGVARVTGGDRVPLDATSPTGTVRELAIVGCGTVIAAADEGLFAADAEHPVLDRADLRWGAPTRGVCSIAADAGDRLWWCTADRFGVLDLRIRAGREFAAADGLPPAPYRRVAVQPDGAVLLATATGTYVYRPDAGEPPRASQHLAVALDDDGGSVLLLAAATARGGASYAVRLRHHHLLQPLVDGRVAGLLPGHHALEVYAFDRDLRRTRLGEVSVDVPLPQGLDPRLLLLAVTLAAAVLFAWAWRRAAGLPAAARMGHAALRTGVLGVVVLQLLAAVFGHGRAWPFIAFSMYTEVWREQDVLFEPVVIGLAEDGRRVPVPEARLGLLQDGHWQMLAEVLYGDETAAQAFFARVAAARPPDAPPFAGFALTDARIRLTAHGPVHVAPTVLMTWRRP